MRLFTRWINQLFGLKPLRGSVESTQFLNHRRRCQ